MSRYTGLSEKLRGEVIRRDRGRCRFCGATNRGVDLHHIVYRRGTVDDVASNLICLCRHCHNTVHGLNRKLPLSKALAQEILFELIDSPGRTGLSLYRRKMRAG